VIIDQNIQNEILCSLCFYFLLPPSLSSELAPLSQERKEAAAALVALYLGSHSLTIFVSCAEILVPPGLCISAACKTDIVY
jgi:hypothetical protein